MSRCSPPKVKKRYERIRKMIRSTLVIAALLTTSISNVHAVSSKMDFLTSTVVRTDPIVTRDGYVLLVRRRRFVNINIKNHIKKPKQSLGSYPFILRSKRVSETGHDLRANESGDRKYGKCQREQIFVLASFRLQSQSTDWRVHTREYLVRVGILHLESKCRGYSGIS